jgi:hypothetical protein
VLAERRKWRREQTIRWDERRVSAYMEYAHAIKKVISISSQLAAQKGHPVEHHFMAPEYGLTNLAAAEEARTVCWEAVLLLGSSEMVLAGRRWHETVFQLELIASGQPAALSWDLAVKAASEARGRFYEAARKDIGIGISAPEHFEWQIGSPPPAVTSHRPERIDTSASLDDEGRPTT